MNARTITLTGKLEQDPDHRTTTRGRSYLRARLLDQELVVWDPEQTQGATLLTRGDQIRVTGRVQEFEFTENGTTRTLERFIVKDLKVLTVTLTGYLGKDPEYRDTQEKSVTGRRWNPVAEMHETYETLRGSRTYLRLSLATHPNGFGGAPAWHQLLIWDGDAVHNRIARIVGKGDRVRVTGRPTTYTFTGDDGVERTLERVIVHDLQILKLKARESA